MRRRLLQRTINQLARERGLTARWTEGADHSKVEVGGKMTTVPRHAEINEVTARSILQYLFGGER